MRLQKPKTFRTYVNGVGRVYSQAPGTNAITPSNKSVFPEYNKFINACIGRGRVLDAIDEVQTEEVEILCDADLEKLFEDVNFDNPHEVQRYNIVVFGYRTGFRADTFEKVLLECFDLSTHANGDKVLTPVISNMKNLAASLNKIDEALFKQQIIECVDPRFCAIEAFKRQRQMLEEAGKEGERNYFFRTSHYWSKKLGTKKSSDQTFRGVAQWVAKVLGRKITFKDISRRVAMTKLANDPAISLVDAAKYLGVQVRTLEIYHRKDKDRVAKAAEILSRYEKPQKEEPKEEKASNSATLSPKREVVCVSLSPVKAQKKRKEQTPSPSSARITIDLTAEEEYASFPLTQLSEREPSTYELNEKESIVYEREMCRSRVWAAPATPAKAPISQDLSAVPSPFAQAMFEEQPKKKVKKEVQVKKEMQCYRCDYPIKKNACGGQRPVTCDICHAVYHMSCAKLRFPPKHGSWACESCVTEMIGSQ